MWRQEFSLCSSNSRGQDSRGLHHQVSLRVPGAEVLCMLKGLRAGIPLGGDQGGVDRDAEVTQGMLNNEILKLIFTLSCLDGISY